LAKVSRVQLVIVSLKLGNAHGFLPIDPGVDQGPELYCIILCNWNQRLLEKIPENDFSLNVAPRFFVLSDRRRVNIHLWRPGNCVL